MAEHPVVGSTTDSERQWAAMAHIAALVLALLTTWFAGFAGMLGAGAIYLMKRDASPFVAEHAREAFNFNVSMFIYALVAIAVGVALGVFTVITLGVGLLLTAPAALVLLLACGAVALLWLVCSIIAAVKAWNGESFRYPLTLRLLS